MSPPRKSSSKSKQIVLAKIESVPLKVIYNPRSPIASLSRRKSPRFASSPGEPKSPPKSGKNQILVAPNGSRKSPSPESVKLSNAGPRSSWILVSVDPNSLRRSPRQLTPMPSLDRAAASPRASSGQKPGKTLALVDPNSLRRSQRFSPSPSPVESPCGGAGKADEKTLRKSPRFSPADRGGDKRSSDVKSQRSKAQNSESIFNEEANTNADFSIKKCTGRSTETDTKTKCSEIVEEKVLPKKKQPQKRSFAEVKSSSPKVTKSEEENGERNPKRVKIEPVLSGKKNLRSSERLLSTTVDSISQAIKKVITEISNEKDVKHSTLSLALETESNMGRNTFDELSDSFDECPTTDDQEESNLIIFSEQCEEQPRKKTTSSNFAKNAKTKKSNVSFFVGDPIPDDEAQERWRWRYEMKDLKSQKSKYLPFKETDDVILDVDCHFAQASVANCLFSLGDCAYIQGDEKKKHVGRIIEFFRTTDGDKFFRVQWFYFVEDTIIQQEGSFHDERRLFYSTVMDDNLIDCIVSKVHVTKITPRVGLKISSIAPADFYYDMEYCVDYSTFRSLGTDNSTKSSSSGLTNGLNAVITKAAETCHTESTLLDLYSGCGGMSTGLSLGSRVGGVNLVTRWAIDCSQSACDSLKLNHPETNVRNEAAEDFLELLKEWEKLCKRYRSRNDERSPSAKQKTTNDERSPSAKQKTTEESSDSDDEDSSEEYEVSKLVDICYGDPNDTGERGLKFRVRWKGYNHSDDTWEPAEGLSNCEEKIEEFLKNGMKMKILPLPTDVDVICGGPPCQGVSGYNRFRNFDSPLEDERNRQIIVFMDIVNFLKPKYVLMENVVDILKFDKGSIGRYAMSRLVHMKYQARMGIIAAGCYGLPQFRLRVFVWGALPHENLPQFPLPTHDVIVRYWPPPEFERNTVAYDEDQPRDLENALVLQDAISDLPPVDNDETREEIPYKKPSESEFQRYIRSSKSEMGFSEVDSKSKTRRPLYDHRTYYLSEDDYTRVCQIPKRKGANFRDLPGVIVGDNNVARRDPNKEKIMLPSGKPLVPDYAFTFEQGRSKRPFARLWWDETVPTVLTYPSCHNQAALHPEQDRILTLREYARLQGFPDYYRFCGTVKKRYCQVGNAVPVNVSRALGFALSLATRKLSSDEPLLTLPRKFSLSSLSQLASADQAPQDQDKTEETDSQLASADPAPQDQDKTEETDSQLASADPPPQDQDETEES